MGNRIIDTRSEWRTFSNSDDGADPSRVGAAQDPLLDGSLLDSTAISMMDGGTGKARELSRAHQRVVHTREDSGLLDAFKHIQVMGERMSLSKLVIDSAKQLFKKVDDIKLLKGKPPQAGMAACLYLACREHRVTRTFQEIYKLTKVSKKAMDKCFRLIHAHFETKTQINLDAFITRFSSHLEIPADVSRAALTVFWLI